jgi:hypothetical protein
VLAHPPGKHPGIILKPLRPAVGLPAPETPAADRPICGSPRWRSVSARGLPNLTEDFQGSVAGFKRQAESKVVRVSHAGGRHKACTRVSEAALPRTTGLSHSCSTGLQGSAYRKRSFWQPQPPHS